MDSVISGLSEAEAARYHRQGFCIPRWRFSSADVEHLKAKVLGVVEANPQLRNQVITAPHLPRSAPDASDNWAMAYSVRPEILDMIEALIGPDLILWTTTIFHRPAVDGVATPWHQDGGTWPVEPLAGASAWVAATHSNRSNGCLRVIPGSHKRPAKHDPGKNGELFAESLLPDAVDESEAVDIELEPGQMLLFHPLLIHGSHPNTGTRPRAGFVMRYIPSTSFFDHQGCKRNGVAPYAERTLFLVRGTDRCARNDFRPNPAA